MKNNTNIVFFGTPQFSKIILEGLIDSGYKPSLVVTSPDKPVGRKHVLTPSDAKAFAQQHDIPVFQPEKLMGEAIDRIQKENPDLIIVAAYGKIIPKIILDIPARDAINVHGSLLPKLRGASPIQTALLHGEKETGITIMLMDEKMDHGAILSQKSLDIAKKETSFTLYDKMAHVGANLLVETINKWLDGSIEPREQNHDKATYTKIIKREDAHISWDKPTQEIENMIRAFTPWPGTFSLWNEKRIKFLSADIDREKKSEKHGFVVAYKNGFAVTCSQGLLIPAKIQMEGKNIQNAEEFLKSHPDIVGSKLK